MKVLLLVLIIALASTGCLVTLGDGRKFECTVFLDDPTHQLKCLPIIESGATAPFLTPPKK